MEKFMGYTVTIVIKPTFSLCNMRDIKIHKKIYQIIIYQVVIGIILTPLFVFGNLNI